MRELAIAVHLGFNDVAQADTVFAGPVRANPEYAERPYWGPHAVEDEAA
jgi:hypothetical protein